MSFEFVNRTNPLSHLAHVVIVGWTSLKHDEHFYIGSVRTEPFSRKWLGKRVKATLYSPRRQEISKSIKKFSVVNIRKAGTRTHNTAYFVIIGHLIRAQKYPQFLSVEVLPQREDIPCFCWHMSATRSVMEICNPAWHSVKITGYIMNHLLVAETIEPVYAPSPPHWQNIKRPTKRRTNLRELRKTNKEKL